MKGPTLGTWEDLQPSRQQAWESSVGSKVASACHPRERLPVAFDPGSRRAGKPPLPLGMGRGPSRARTASACASALTWRCMCINDPATAPDRPRGPHALGCCLCRKAFTQRPSWSSTCACTGARGPWSASHPCGRPSVSARTWRGTADHTLGRGGRTLTALLGVKVTVTVRGAATY